MTSDTHSKWLKYMPGVQEQRQTLRLVEAAWDNLVLLSSLSSLTAHNTSESDLGRSRTHFSALAAEMVEGLAQEHVKQLEIALRDKAQVCIDILVRNLFERTADIGFLATDAVLTDYAAQPDRAQREAIEARLATYVSFYTVYQQAMLLDTEFRPIACYPAAHTDLHAAETRQPLSTKDRAWLQDVMGSHAPYTERHGRLDFMDTHQESLVYAKRVEHQGQVVGVLCLRFRVDDELPALFSALLDDGRQRPFCLAIMDAEGRIIGASDTLLLPQGYPLSRHAGPVRGVIRHMGREFLACEVKPHPFEGYAGPGWTGLCMVPLDLAFEDGTAEDRASDLLQEVTRQTTFLNGALQSIPARSRAIQTALERSVWNGLLDIGRLQGQDHEAGHMRSQDALFAQTLLSEIGVTAQKTAHAFTSALSNLYRVVASATMDDARHRAQMAMQILDRNLYERANDCRWWAQTPGLIEALMADDPLSHSQSAGDILHHIHRLYTVYAGLVLFDARGHLVAVSRPDWASMLGMNLSEPWAQACLRLQHAHQYQASAWETSCLHPDAPTFIYAAALRAPDSQQVIGGIGVVWDSQAQLSAMLRDCAPDHAQTDEANPDGLMFVHQSAGIMLQHGLSTAEAAVDHSTISAVIQHPEEPVIEMQGHLFGVGASAGVGYREYRCQDQYEHGVQCLVFRHLCPRESTRHDWGSLQRIRKPAVAPGTNHTRLATFTCGTHWLALPDHQILFATADCKTLPVGHLRSPFLGMARLEQSVYPVLDLRLAVDATLSAVDISREADVERQMVVVNVAMPDRGPVALALRVDELKSMIDVPVTQLQRLNHSQDTCGFIDQVVGFETSPGADDAGARHQLLMVIAERWLQQAAQGLAASVHPAEWESLR